MLTNLVFYVVSKLWEAEQSSILVWNFKKHRGKRTIPCFRRRLAWAGLRIVDLLCGLLLRRRRLLPVTSATLACPLSAAFVWPGRAPELCLHAGKKTWLAGFRTRQGFKNTRKACAALPRKAFFFKKKFILYLSLYFSWVLLKDYYILQQLWQVKVMDDKQAIIFRWSKSTGNVSHSTENCCN